MKKLLWRWKSVKCTLFKEDFLEDMNYDEITIMKHSSKFPNNNVLVNRFVSLYLRFCSEIICFYLTKSIQPFHRDLFGGTQTYCNRVSWRTCFSNCIKDKYSAQIWFAKLKKGYSNLDYKASSNWPSMFDEDQFNTLIKEDDGQTSRELPLKISSDSSDNF